jgi:CRISP-associated protein Cas1
LELAIPTVKIQRNDPLELQQGILEMSPAERKRLGINKSTLWYQKKKLAAGKSVKVYSKVFKKLLECF